MIYSKLDGTTSKKFKVGKGGPELAKELEGQLSVTDGDGTKRVIGISDIRLDPISANDIPTVASVQQEVNRKIRTVTSGSLLAYLDTVGEIQEDDYVFLQKEVI